MNKRIDLTPLLDETGEADALTYLIKLYLKEHEGLPIKIDPMHIAGEMIEVEYGYLEYKFILDKSFELEYEYKHEEQH